MLRREARSRSDGRAGARTRRLRVRELLVREGDEGIGMLVSESHPLTPVYQRIVQSITTPSFSRIIVFGEA